MTYPSENTINNQNQENLDQIIKLTSYLAQTFASGVVRFFASKEATSSREHNKADSLASAPPFARGATLSKTPVNTTLVTEPFSRFGDLVILDYADRTNSRPTRVQIQQQARSIVARILRELNKQFFEGNGSAPNLKETDRLLT